MKPNQVIEMDQPAKQQNMPTVTTPSDLLRLAVEQGADMGKLEKLMELQERWEANQARKAFVEAMAEFKKHAPEIYKDKDVSFSGTSYSHATLGGICEVVIEALARHGFSHDWDTTQPDNGMIKVSCILTHILGHSKSTSMEAPPDNSGKKNGIQQIASTVTYLQRYTLLAACGLATKDMPDNDGATVADTALADEWVANAKAALNLEVLDSTWKMGVAAINAAGDKAAYDAFKAAVVAKKAELQKGAQS